MNTAMHLTHTQRRWARLAGALCVYNYFLNGFGIMAPSFIKGHGEFAERAARVIASEPLYRWSLVSMTIGWVTVVVLAFALYVTLEPVNKRLAQLALFCRLGEAFVGGATTVIGFVILRLYTAAHGAGPFEADQLQLLARVARAALDSGHFIAWTFFAPGSILFFYLFRRSGYIPRALATFGMVSSVLMLVGNGVALVFPQLIVPVQVGWVPIGLAEFTTALWLLLRGVEPARVRVRSLVPA